MPASNSAEALYDFGSDSTDAIGRDLQARHEITTRLASGEDVVEYFGEPHRGTMRAIVAVMDGRVVGVVGVVREGPIGKYFCDLGPELMPHLKTMVIMRAIKQSMEFVHEYQGPLVAIAEHAEGCRILNRLGFTHLQGALYGWLR
jgi:hypothetical protein